MKLVLETPAKLRFEAIDDNEFSKLQVLLKYKDKSVEENIRRIKKNPYWHKRLGQEDFQKLIDSLHAELYKSLFFQDDIGFYTLPGLRKLIEDTFPNVQFENNVTYHEFRSRPWEHMPPYEPKVYQSEALEKLLGNWHSHVEIATGLGKTFLSVLLVKETGLPVVISTPRAGLARSLYKDLVYYFGKRRVGLLGDGKREIGKEILVAVGKSLSMIQDEDLEKFKKYQILISDESHTLPANEFNYFCHNVLGHCAYRWFMSGTQERNDGKDLLLDGIIGQRVYEKTIQQGMADGDLAKLNTLVCDVPSYAPFMSSTNVVKMNQKHFYENPYILDIVCTLVKDAMSEGMPTLILIDEHEQERRLREKLGLIYTYARGGADTDKICRDFNEGKIMCVVGTSAVSVGTNFMPVRLTINWQGGKAETKFKQGVIGRSTRVDPRTGKTECKIVDFRITNVPMLNRHANARVRLYKDIGPVNYLEYKA